MQSTAYTGFFKDGQFYVSGHIIPIPEQRRIMITLLEDSPKTDKNKLAAWNRFKRMVAETTHENHLLSDDFFKRDTTSRELIVFENEVDV